MSVLITVAIAIVIGLLLWRVQKNNPQLILLVAAGAIILSAISWKVNALTFTLSATIKLAHKIINGELTIKEAFTRLAAVVFMVIILGFVINDLASTLFWGNDSQICSWLSFLHSTVQFTDLNWPKALHTLQFATSICGLGLFTYGLIKRNPIVTVIGVCIMIAFGVSLTVEWVDKTTGYTPNHKFRPVLIFLSCTTLVAIVIKKLR